jgi:hypothetical protein
VIGRYVIKNSIDSKHFCSNKYFENQSQFNLQEIIFIITSLTVDQIKKQYNDVSINSNSVVTMHATCLAISHDKHSVRSHQYLS